MRFLRRHSTPDHVAGPLAEVLEAEKAAAAAIAAATLEAAAWLAGERHAIATATDATLKALAAAAAADQEAARQSASARAAAIVAAADQLSRELSALSDRDLALIVARHVASIIPGPPP